MKRALACLTILAGAACSAVTVPTDWEPVDAAVRAQIRAGQIPGAVVIVGDAQRIWLRRAWGHRALQPRARPMTPDTIFDLASLTKPICTATAVLQLVDHGRLALDEPVSRRWPAFGANGKQDITPRQLLSHSSGLREGFSWTPGEPGDAAEAKLVAERLTSAPGTRRLYSDLNFIALGMLVERVSGERLDRYCGHAIFAPLGMQDTRFLPAPLQLSRIAPTEREGQGWLRGVVQDPTARRMGGVAGHAGLFGSADDLARFAQGMLRRAAAFPLLPQTVDAMARPSGPTVQEAWQGLGWELAPPLVADRELLPPLGVITHTGYTGTAMWIDLVNRRFLIVLSSRLHADGQGDARPLRRQLAALVSSLSPPMTVDQLVAHDPAFAPHLGSARSQTRGVLPGIDVLRLQAYGSLRGHKVGLVTNLSAIDSQGWRTLDRLRLASGVALVRVFSPEHGLYGDLEGPVESGVERFSDTPVLSLYGHARRPSPEMLKGIDTLVFDVQDAGARYFTYISTLAEVLHAAGEAGRRVVVLDRPNPVGGDRVGGPMLDANRLSFTGVAPMPVEHGMTIGEVARFLQARQQTLEGLAVDLQVVPMQGYRRAMLFRQTGLDWMPPSPNLLHPETALLYTGVAWVEGSNVSVGRGTAHPFEWLGAPWIDGNRLADALLELHLPGLDVRPLAFVPAAAPFQGRRCEGVALRVTDPQAFDGPRLGAALLQALAQLWPRTFRIESTVDMVGSVETVQAIRDGLPLDDLQALWASQREFFLQARQAALLYPD